MSNSIYDKLSEERKRLQEQGEVPEWMTTAGYQLLRDKYLAKGQTPKERYRVIAKTAVKHLPVSMQVEAEEKFFELFWKGWLSPSTPVLSNMGTNRGLPVSCSGQYIGDSIESFYGNLREAAVLTKHGFGTSGYLGDVRPRGSAISVGGKASGPQPVIEDFFTMSSKVSQGGTRRGAWAGYLPVDHPDFYELVHFVENNPDDANVGWTIRDKFIEQLDNAEDEKDESHVRFKRTMKLKSVQGKGYFHFPDKVNRLRPQMYIDKGLFVNASNLCSEIQLFSDEDHTFTCVLSSMNDVYYDDWKNTDAVFWATIFLDCVVSEFLMLARKIDGLEKAVRFTEKGRAIGLGQMGLHSLFQKRYLPFESTEAFELSNEIASYINDESLRASKFLASILGEPEWCVGYGLRFTHRIAIAPTKSTALIMGGSSEGIAPDPAMVYNQTTAGGEVSRINPYLLEKMKELGVYNKTVIKDIIDHFGSVQHVTWLDAYGKAVFKTAFEINQLKIIEMASARQLFVDQGQSLNLFFSADEDEEWIAYVHYVAFHDPFILALYYTYSQAGVSASRGECLACM